MVDLTLITRIALICFAIISEISVWLRKRAARLGVVAMSQVVDLTLITRIALICFAIIGEISVWLRKRAARLGVVVMTQVVDKTLITRIALNCFAIISEISVWLRKRTRVCHNSKAGTLTALRAGKHVQSRRQTNLFDLLRCRHVSGN